MVLVGIILALFIGIAIFGFGGSISGAISDRLKSPELRAREDEQIKIDRESSQKRADKGAIDNTFDFIFGEKAGEQVRARKTKEAIATTDAEIEKQARQAGFANRDELALATDSGSLVVGSSKNVIDFGLIGAPEEAITVKKRFGGKTKIGTRDQAVTRPKITPVIDLRTRGGKRFGR